MSGNAWLSHHPASSRSHLHTFSICSLASRSELPELFEEISALSVEHMNIDYRCVSRALDLLPELAGLHSPLYDKVFKWRARNFYGSRQRRGLPQIIQFDNKSGCKHIMGRTKWAVVFHRHVYCDNLWHE